MGTSSTRPSRPRRCLRRCPTPTISRDACRFRGSGTRRAAATGPRVTGLDSSGEPISVEGTGYLARCLQHETDHLTGLLYLDRLIGRNHRGARKMIKRHGCGRCPETRGYRVPTTTRSVGDRWSTRMHHSPSVSSTAAGATLPPATGPPRTSFRPESPTSWPHIPSPVKEVGSLYPSWEQAVALARFLDVRGDLAHRDARPCHHETRPLFRLPGGGILSRG